MIEVISTCRNFFATVSLRVPAVSAQHILPAWIIAALVARLAMMFGFVHQHTVHRKKFAVADVAILVLVTIFGEFVKHLFASPGDEGMQCCVSATESDLFVVIDINSRERTVGPVVIDATLALVHGI